MCDVVARTVIFSLTAAPLSARLARAPGDGRGSHSQSAHRNPHVPQSGTGRTSVCIVVW